MKNVKKPFEKAVVSTSIMMGVISIMYFLIIWTAGWALNLDTRIVNIILLGLAVYIGISKFKKNAADHFSYMRGLLCGVVTSAFTSFIVALFLWLFMEFIDPKFFQDIYANAKLGYFINPYIIGVSIIVEGTAMGFIFSFIVMMLFSDETENV